jgi:hypothetical protein
MADDFEAEVKRVKPKPGARQTNKDLASQRGKRPPKEDEPKEDSPLKTVGGTPIVERTPEG